MSMPTVPMYTIQRCRKDGTTYGPVHYSHDGEWTFCGAQTGPIWWWILTNCFDGEATCKKCIAINGRNRCGN